MRKRDKERKQAKEWVRKRESEKRERNIFKTYQNLVKKEKERLQKSEWESEKEREKERKRERFLKRIQI
jgi:hypothetical protein